MKSKFLSFLLITLATVAPGLTSNEVPEILEGIRLAQRLQDDRWLLSLVHPQCREPAEFSHVVMLREWLREAMKKEIPNDATVLISEYNADAESSFPVIGNFPAEWVLVPTTKAIVRTGGGSYICTLFLAPDTSAKLKLVCAFPAPYKGRQLYEEHYVSQHQFKAFMAETLGHLSTPRYKELLELVRKGELVEADRLLGGKGTNLVGKAGVSPKNVETIKYIKGILEQKNVTRSDL